MISGFDELLELVAEERRRRIEQRLSRPSYRLDERGAIVETKPPLKPVRPREGGS